MSQDKKWYEYLFEAMASLWTSEQLKKISPHSTLQGSKTTMIDLPSGFDAFAEEDLIRQKLIAFMRSHLGDKYQLGIEVQPGHEDESHLWDCSESVEAAFRKAGKFIPDGAQFQYDYCHPVSLARAGDLHFLWSDKRGMIGHVMMSTGLGTVIHAVGGRGVVEDPETMWTSHIRYRGLRRHPDFNRPKEERV